MAANKRICEVCKENIEGDRRYSLLANNESLSKDLKLVSTSAYSNLHLTEETPVCEFCEEKIHVMAEAVLQFGWFDKGTCRLCQQPFGIEKFAIWRQCPLFIILCVLPMPDISTSSQICMGCKDWLKKLGTFLRPTRVNEPVERIAFNRRPSSIKAILLKTPVENQNKLEETRGKVYQSLELDIINKANDKDVAGPSGVTTPKSTRGDKKGQPNKSEKRGTPVKRKLDNEGVNNETENEAGPSKRPTLEAKGTLAKKIKIIDIQIRKPKRLELDIINKANDKDVAGPSGVTTPKSTRGDKKGQPNKSEKRGTPVKRKLDNEDETENVAGSSKRPTLEAKGTLAKKIKIIDIQIRKPKRLELDIINKKNDKDVAGPSGVTTPKSTRGDKKGQPNKSQKRGTPVKRKLVNEGVNNETENVAGPSKKPTLKPQGLAKKIKIIDILIRKSKTPKGEEEAGPSQMPKPLKGILKKGTGNRKGEAGPSQMPKPLKGILKNKTTPVTETPKKSAKSRRRNRPESPPVTFSCDQCSFKSHDPNPARLYHHKKIHELRCLDGPDPHCSMCLVTFPMEVMAPVDYRERLTTGRFFYICRVCGNYFPHKICCLNHYLLHRVKDESQFFFEGLDKFTREEFFACAHCCYSDVDISRMPHHVREHYEELEDENIRQFYCRMCSFVFYCRHKPKRLCNSARCNY